MKVSVFSGEFCNQYVLLHKLIHVSECTGVTGLFYPSIINTCFVLYGCILEPITPMMGRMQATPRTAYLSISATHRPTATHKLIFKGQLVVTNQPAKHVFELCKECREVKNPTGFAFTWRTCKLHRRDPARIQTQQTVLPHYTTVQPQLITPDFLFEMKDTLQ